MENTFTFSGTLSVKEGAELNKALKTISESNEALIIVNSNCADIKPQEYKGCIIGNKRVLVFHSSNSNKGFAIGGTSLRCSFVNQFIFSNG